MKDIDFNDVLERAAQIADAHKGHAAKARQDRGHKLSNFDPATIEVIEHEERGEDIAAEEIARKIRALKVNP